jgi:ABC-type antimicrobial peptide transport system permease subunit
MRKQFYDRLLLDLKSDAQFEAAGLTSRFRMVFANNSPVEIEGRTYQVNKDRIPANSENVSSGFFGVTGQKLIEGRLFADDETDQRQPVAVVNAAFAQKMFGRESALGRRFRTTAADGTRQGPWRTVIGVVSTVRMLGPFNNPGLDDSGFYVPFYATTFGPVTPALVVSQFTTVVVRPHAGQDVGAMANVLRAKVNKADPNLPLYFVGTPKAQQETFVAANRVIATMFSIFGLVAIVLASVGIYGVMSFSVNQRTNEFGVRMALGASRSGILQNVLLQGVRLIAFGLLLALPLAYLLTTQLAARLYGIGAFDPATLIAVACLLGAVAMLACWLPARRAASVSPIEALRYE